MNVGYAGLINPEITVSDLLLLWQLGGEDNCEAVLHALANDHPGLTAMFINVGCTERKLTTADVNRITNELIDVRVALVRNSDVSEAP